MTDGFGAVTWWGFSPAIDLQDEDAILALKKMKLTETDQHELNILLIGAGDIRHVLMTIARTYRHRKRKLHFYILENSLEIYARDMLFLTIALEPQNRMGLQEKTELFLELYGNILVRKQSEEYVEKMAHDFIRMVTDFDYLQKTLPVVDLSLLKFKERDFLEAIFKFWRNPDVENVFEVSKYWDLRMRKYLGVRYDTRLNVFDWDYQMRLAQRDADIINVHEYKNWRNTGVAFEVREADYDVPNKTVASGLILRQDGEKHARRGYWGDILVSPFVALGIECEEQSFLKKSNKQFTSTASHIAEYNVLSMFHEIATKTKYVPPEPQKETEKEKEGPKLQEIIEEEEEEAEEKSEESKKEEVLRELQETEETDEGGGKQQMDSYVAMSLEDVTISFLPLASLLDLPKKGKYQKLFHIIYFSNSLVHLLKPEINPIFADKATVIMETARYMLELKLEEVKTFVSKIEGLAKAAGCKTADKSCPEKANFLKMTFERESS